MSQSYSCSSKAAGTGSRRAESSSTRAAEHIVAFGPTFAKALVRYNPEDDAVLNRRQIARLKQRCDGSRPGRPALTEMDGFAVKAGIAPSAEAQRV